MESFSRAAVSPGAQLTDRAQTEKTRPREKPSELKQHLVKRFAAVIPNLPTHADVAEVTLAKTAGA